MYLSDKPIVIFGAGIAGLWLFHRLRRLGYHTILLESKGIGGGQSLSSQGIIHSGMKYAFGGIWDKDIRALISILSQMPDRWEKSLKIGDEVDLSTMLSTDFVGNFQILVNFHADVRMSHTKSADAPCGLPFVTKGNSHLSSFCRISWMVAHRTENHVSRHSCLCQRVQCGPCVTARFHTVA